MSVVPKSWMPACNMERIICHWTAGGYKASSLDRAHYHVLIEMDGDLVRGLHEISDNVYTGDGDYAAHTLGTNTGSIGISVCCMAGAREKPFDGGKYPMTQAQWHKMAEVAADLARVYNIPVTPKTVLGHGEVQATLGKKQNGKWDPMVLPWDQKLSKAKVGDLFRAEVQAALGGSAGAKPSFAASGEGLPLSTALLNGTTLTHAVFFNEDVFLALSELQSVPGLNVAPGVAGQPVTVSSGSVTFPISPEALVSDDPNSPVETWLSAKTLASGLDAKLSFDPDRNVVALAWA